MERNVLNIFFSNCLIIMKFQKKIFKRKYFSSSSLSPFRGKKCFKYFFFKLPYYNEISKKKYLKENTFLLPHFPPLGEIYIDRCLQKEKGPKGPQRRCLTRTI